MFFYSSLFILTISQKRQECLILEETEIMLVESAVLWQEWLARLFTQIFTPSNKKKRAFYEPAWYYVT